MAPNDILLDTGILGPGHDAESRAASRNLDFDVMEIANGAQGRATTRRYLADARRLVLAAARRTSLKPGTGVSDSHRITVEHAGWSRTYVLGAGDDPARLDVARVQRAA